MLSTGAPVYAAVQLPRRSVRRVVRTSCIAAPERPATSTTPGGSLRSLPPATTTDRAASGRQASAAPGLMVTASPAPRREPVPVTRKLLLRKDFEWADASYNPKTRSSKIWAFALTLQARLWLLDKKWSYPSGFTAEKEVQRRRALAAWIRENLLALGPTFIKLGQLFSARSDLLPKEVTEELSLLQDQVPSFSAEKAESIIREEFGAGTAELFAVFDPQPLAAASLGQVHYAQLKSGQQVVVKVQRPGLKQLFEIDLATLKDIAAALDKQDSSRDFKSIAEECSLILLEEIDYILEGRNADRFRRDFAPYPWVRVPTVYWRTTSPRVVTLEYMPGAKISDVQSHLENSLDPKRIASAATEAYLIQILKTGFFHADPHPGNVAVDTQGNLVYYDFGMMGKIETLTRQRLTDLFYAIYKKDAEGVAKLLVELKILVPTQDLTSVKRSIAFFLQRLGEQTQRQETVGTIGEDLFAVATDQPFRFPATFTFVLRAFGTLEGIGAALDSDFKFAKVAQPYAQELLNLEDKTEQRRFALAEIRKQVGAVSLAAASMPQRVERMNDQLERLESGDIRLRVRTLEVERAARRQSVMQSATLNAIAAAGLLNVGTQLALAGSEVPAQAALGAALLCTGLVLREYLRVERLDEFEKDIKRGGGSF